MKIMYRRPKFLEVLHAIREEMSREADYDVDLFARWSGRESALAWTGESDSRFQNSCAKS